MKILYHNPPCGSGIESIGYIFLLLLKRLGHEIDLWNTQCAHLQADVISKTIDNYDSVILNSPHILSFTRIIQKEKKNIYVIDHTGEPLKDFAKLLSLNYLYQIKFFFEAGKSNIIFPVTYPYFYNQKIKIHKKRKYRFIYIGRWNRDKFNDQVKKFMIQNKIFIDVAYITYPDHNYSYSEIIKEVKFDIPINQVSELFSNAEYLLFPSTTECITLSSGEALVAGCIPIVYETQYQEHEQFYNTIRCYSMDEFNQTIKKLAEKKADEVFRQKVMDFSQRMWSIDKTIEELRMIFGSTGKKGKINVMYNDHNDMTNILPYKNACIITGETL